MEGHNPNTEPNTPQEQTPAGNADPAVTLPAEQTQQPAFSIDALDSVDEATKLAAVNKLLGKNYTSLSEAIPSAQPTAEQIEEQRKQRERDMTTWAVANEKLTLDDIKRAGEVQGKDARTKAFALFSEDYRVDNPNATDEEINQMFSDVFHEEEAEDSSRRQQATRLINKMAKEYESRFTSPLEAASAAYEQHSTREKGFSGFSKTIEDVVAGEIPKKLSLDYTYKDSSGAEVTFPVSFDIPQEIVDSLRKDFASQSVYDFMGDNVDKATLKSEIQTQLNGKVFDAAIKAVAAQIAQNVETHVRAQMKNIPATGNGRLPVGAPPAPKQPISHTNSLAAQSRTGR